MTQSRSGHRLDALLAPRSVAVVGASAKANTPGDAVLRMGRLAGFEGPIYPVNPGYDEVDGRRCYPSLDALPDKADLVVLAVANTRLESALEAAIGHGARALTIFASGLAEADASVLLAQRIRDRVRAAGLPLCGGNCMGFYNLDRRLRIAAYESDLDMDPGGIAFIAQSGSIFGALAHNDRRLRFNLAVSSGGEWVTTAADYLDWALDQPTTRVAALFLESVRDPAGFKAALAKAQARDVPVVVLKVGRTPESAAMALSHTGALAGSDAAYRALFDRYGVVAVDHPDEMAAALLLFGHDRRPAAGGLAAMHDSGGERELAVDLNARVGVPYARISEATRARLAGYLDIGLEPMNPLDAWGTGRDTEGQFAAMMGALLDDEDTAIGVFFADIRDGYHLSETYLRAMLSAAERTRKPLAIATNYSLLRHQGIARRATAAGIPVLDGTEEALKAVRHVLAYRDRAGSLPAEPACPVPDGVREAARRRAAAGPFRDHEALAVLESYGIPGPPWAIAASETEAVSAAARIGYPVVLKTAEPGIAHKTEVGGVRVGIADGTALARAYRDLAARLGPQVLVQGMSRPGVEIALGTVTDPDFGPYLMIAAGGTLVELLDDTAVTLAPVGAAGARAMIDRLKVARLLRGWRGAAPTDVGALADCAGRLSWLAADLAAWVAEIDVNPVIVRPDGCAAVDALFVPRAGG